MRCLLVTKVLSSRVNASTPFRRRVSSIVSWNDFQILHRLARCASGVLNQHRIDQFTQVIIHSYKINENRLENS